MKHFLTSIICLLAALPLYASDPREDLNTAMEFYTAGNCIDALPVFEKIIKSYQLNAEQSYSLNYYAGYCARHNGDMDLAYGYLHTALDEAIELDETEQIPVLHMFVEEVQRERGDYEEAADHYSQAIALLPDDSADIATAFYFLAETYRLDQKYEDSVSNCEKAVDIARKLKLISIETSCLTSTGEVYNEMGDYQKAIKTFTEALTIAHNAQLPLEMANIHLGTGLVYQELGKNDLARQHYEEALKFYVLCANVTNIPMIVDRLITLPPCTKAQAARAVENYRNYAESFSAMGDEDSALYIQLLVGYYQQIAEDIEAANTYQQVLSLAIEHNLPYQVYESAVALADVLNTESFEDAIEALVRAQQFDSIQNPLLYLAKIYAEKGKLYKEHGFYSLAENNYANAIASTYTTEDKDDSENALNDLQNRELK